MNELNPTVDLGTLIFDQIGEIRFTSAFLNSSNEIVVENSRLAAFIEENSEIAVVQVIGKVLVLYLPATEEKYQKYSLELPKSN